VPGLIEIFLAALIAGAGWTIGQTAIRWAIWRLSSQFAWWSNTPR
jgi:uncharacterized BrkB/YihY/UPF0761 family membrane protein